MKNCAKCSMSNPDNETICVRCGAAFAPQRMCPANRHVLPPGVGECSICQMEGSAQPGRVQGGIQPPNRPRTLADPSINPGPPPLPGGLPSRSETKGDDRGPLPPRVFHRPPAPTPPPQSSGKPTVFSDPNVKLPAPPSLPPSLAQRKMVGVLISYSWNPDGEIYPLREGRNFIGRDADCEVCIAMDPTMSGKNSHITYRNNFVVGDMVSMLGTYLGQTPIEEQFLSLPNYSKIRAGSTDFIFIAVNPV